MVTSLATDAESCAQTLIQLRRRMPIRERRFIYKAQKYGNTEYMPIVLMSNFLKPGKPCPAFELRLQRMFIMNVHNR
jgi:hypothetical protein